MRKKEQNTKGGSVWTKEIKLFHASRERLGNEFNEQDESSRDGVFMEWISGLWAITFYLLSLTFYGQVVSFSSKKSRSSPSMAATDLISNRIKIEKYCVLKPHRLYSLHMNIKKIQTLTASKYLLSISSPPILIMILFPQPH